MGIARHTGVLGFCLLLPIAALGLVPVGSEFQVNTYTTNRQYGGHVAFAPNGNFVVVWTSEDQYSAYQRVVGQRYSSDGSPIGGEFFANNITTIFQSASDVATDGSGNFIIVWGGGDGYGSGVVARRFASTGSPIGTEFQINSYTPGFQGSAAITMQPSGDFVVVWSSYSGQDGSNFGVFGRRFNSSGSALGADFQLNTYTTGQQAFQFHGAIDSDSSGNFVVVWQSNPGQDGSAYGVFGQRFSSAGAPIGTEFRANTYTTFIQKSAAVSMDDDGNFVVVWGSIGQDGDGYGVFGQRFASGGAHVGTEFRVNTYTTLAQRNAFVEGKGDGSFVVTWTSATQDGDNYGIFARRYDRGGNPTASEQQVNTTTGGSQSFNLIGMAQNGAFVVTWMDGYPSTGLDGDSSGVFAQRFAPPINDYKCYQGKDLANPPFNKLQAHLSDDTTTAFAGVTKLKYVCNPVDLDNKGVIDPNAYLTCYQIKGGYLSPRPSVELSTQFQASQFELKKGKLLCLPSTQTLLP